MKADNLRLDIISTLARTNPGLLTPAERMKVADSIDPRLQDRYQHTKATKLPPVSAKPMTPQQDARLKAMLQHLQNGGTVDGATTPIGQPADLLRGLSDQDAYQMQLANKMLTMAVRGGYEVDTEQFARLYAALSPGAQNRFLELKHYYGDVAADRRPFQPRIDAETFLRADGHDMQVAGKFMGAMDTIEVIGGLAERMRENEPAHERKSREERSSHKPDLRDYVDASHMAHEYHNSGDSGIADASEAFREIAPSVRDSIVAVDTFLGDKDG